MKTCNKCGDAKPVSDSYANKLMKSGLLSACKECVKRRERERFRENSTDPAWVEKERGRGRDKYHRLYSSGLEFVTQDCPEEVKRVARNIINNAVRDQKVVRPASCTKCGKAGGVEAHHPDYYKPLEVDWLCRKCHVTVGHLRPKTRRGRGNRRWRRDCAAYHEPSKET